MGIETIAELESKPKKKDKSGLDGPVVPGLVDKTETLSGQEKIVIKPLGSLLQGTEGLAGATDGKIALIMDVPTLMSSRVH